MFILQKNVILISSTDLHMELKHGDKYTADHSGRAI
jgi:hypothetical protein